MPNCLLKKVLPFTLMFLVGAALGSLPSLFSARQHRKQHVAAFQRSHHETEVVVRKKSCRAYRQNFNTEAHGSTRILTTAFPGERAANFKSWTPSTIAYAPRPQYTETAREAGIDGIVRLRVTVGEDGKVSNVETLSELPYGLTGEALRAAEETRFVPARLNGRAVSSDNIIESVFHLTRTGECKHER